MIKAVDKGDPDYCSTFVMTTDTDSYLSWSEDCGKDEMPDLKAASAKMFNFYIDGLEDSTQEIWTDQVAKVKAKYDAFGMKATYLDMT